MGNYEQHSATSETAADLQIRQAQKQIHTSLPAKVEQFNSENQTVTLAIQIKQILSDGKSVIISTKSMKQGKSPCFFSFKIVHSNAFHRLCRFILKRIDL